MRAIVKVRVPPSLTAHRQTPHSDYDNYSEKPELREALVGEQRGLCCYCMRRIRAEASAMKIEHWHCRAHYPRKQLSYRNLLGACRGGEGKPPDEQHCDTRKGNRNLLWNPAEPAHDIESKVQYDPDGTIRSSDTRFDYQLNQVLNLNLAELKNHRKAVYDAIAEWWKKEKHRHRGPVPRARIERIRERYLAARGILSPCCQVAVSFLNRKLARSR